MKYHVQIWHVDKPERFLEALQVLVQFDVAIAWVSSRMWKERELWSVGLVFPHHKPKKFDHRAFNHALFEISESEDVKLEVGTIKLYHTPISPIAPGDGGEIELEDCLYVPLGFVESIDD